MVAADTIHATLYGIGEDIFQKHGLADFFRDVFFLGKGLPRGFVFDEFDPKEQPEPANFSDMRMGRSLTGASSKSGSFRMAGHPRIRPTVLILLLHAT